MGSFEAWSTTSALGTLWRSRSKRCLAARILEIPRNGIASRQLRMTWRAQFSKHPCNMLQLPRVDRFCGDSLFLDVGYKWLQYKHVFLEQWLYGKMVICLWIAPDVQGHHPVVIRKWQAALWGTLQHLIRIYQNHFESMALFEHGVYPQMPMVISG